MQLISYRTFHLFSLLSWESLTFINWLLHSKFEQSGYSITIQSRSPRETRFFCLAIEHQSLSNAYTRYSCWGCPTSLAIYSSRRLSIVYYSKSTSLLFRFSDVASALLMLQAKTSWNAINEINSSHEQLAATESFLPERTALAKCVSDWGRLRCRCVGERSGGEESRSLMTG